MRVLDIHQSAIDHPIRLDLAMIEAEMLWPHDDGARNRAIKAAFAQQYIAAAKAQDSMIDAESAEALHAAPRLVNINEGAEVPFRHGIVAGRILLESVVAASIDYPTSPIPALKRQLAAAFRNDQVSESSINNTIWPRYRSVSHLWAAYLERDYTGNDVEFPCSYKQIGSFIALSEEFRRLGESLRLPKSPTTSILNAADMLRLPISIRLPELQLGFAPKPIN